eukprot:scpid14124/ scgid27641/ 
MVTIATASFRVQCYYSCTGQTCQDQHATVPWSQLSWLQNGCHPHGNGQLSCAPVSLEVELAVGTVLRTAVTCSAVRCSAECCAVQCCMPSDLYPALIAR